MSEFLSAGGTADDDGGVKKGRRYATMHRQEIMQSLPDFAKDALIQ